MMLDSAVIDWNSLRSPDSLWMLPCQSCSSVWSRTIWLMSTPKTRSSGSPSQINVSITSCISHLPLAFLLGCHNFNRSFQQDKRSKFFFLSSFSLLFSFQGLARTRFVMSSSMIIRILSAVRGMSARQCAVPVAALSASRRA